MYLILLICTIYIHIFIAVNSVKPDCIIILAQVFCSHTIYTVQCVRLSRLIIDERQSFSIAFKWNSFSIQAKLSKIQKEVWGERGKPCLFFYIWRRKPELISTINSEHIPKSRMYNTQQFNGWMEWCLFNVQPLIIRCLSFCWEVSKRKNKPNQVLFGIYHISVISTSEHPWLARIA